MTDTEPVPASGSLWRIPDWYRRVGLMSWFFLGIAAAVAPAIAIDIERELKASGFFDDE